MTVRPLRPDEIDHDCPQCGRPVSDKRRARCWRCILADPDTRRRIDEHLRDRGTA